MSPPHCGGSLHVALQHWGLGEYNLLSFVLDTSHRTSWQREVTLSHFYARLAKYPLHLHFHCWVHRPMTPVSNCVGRGHAHLLPSSFPSPCFVKSTHATSCSVGIIAFYKIDPLFCHVTVSLFFLERKLLFPSYPGISPKTEFQLEHEVHIWLGPDLAVFFGGWAWRLSGPHSLSFRFCLRGVPVFHVGINLFARKTFGDISHIRISFRLRLWGPDI